MNSSITNCYALVLVFLLVSCAWDQEESSVDCSLSPISISVVESADTQCGTAQGILRVAASGGEAPYLFELQQLTSATGEFSGLAAGNYTVLAEDAAGCFTELNVSINNLNGVNLDDIILSEAGCGVNNGSIRAVVSGGEEPYSFSLDGGAAQNGDTFSGVSRGAHTIGVIDQQGCETQQEVTVLSGVTYQNTIKDIIANNCAISGCHNGTKNPDFRVFSNIQNNAANIKRFTGNRSMPVDATITQDQIDAIACWVDDGALNN